jgi:hypothetical protein
MLSLIDQLESAGLAKRRPSATDCRARMQSPPWAAASSSARDA